MSRRKTIKGALRFALVPHPGCVCEQCLMIGSRGFVYEKQFAPHGASKFKCKCEFMPGIKGETRIDGYDPKNIEMHWRTAREIRLELDITEYEMKDMLQILGIDTFENISAEDFVGSFVDATSLLDSEVKPTVSNIAKKMLSESGKRDIANAIEFYDGHAANVYFVEHSNMLKHDELAAESFNSWTLDSGVINKYARGETNALTKDQIAIAEIQSKHMDRFIQNSELKDDVIVWRTVKESTFKNVTVDDVYVDRGYTATSCEFDAIRGGVDGTGKNSVWLKILVKAGNGRGAYINSVSEWKDGEFEYLIHRDAEIDIINMYVDDSGRKIYEGVLKR